MVFSVIMPIYGVERYLRQGIDSVLAQSFGDFEIILVDDHSPDGCPDICEEYAQRDSRVRVIHKSENQGLGEARNTGFAVAKGEYIFYMDSDDTIKPNLLETVFDTLNSEKNADIVVYGLENVHENKDGQIYKSESLCAANQIAQSPEEIGECFVNLSGARVFPFAWNKIYKRDFLIKCDVAFERTKLIEDFLFNIQIFPKAEKIVVLDKVLYNYRKPSHVTLASSYSPDFFDLCKRKFLLEREFIRKQGVESNENKQFVMLNHLKHIISTLIKNGSKQAGLTYKEQKRLASKILQDADTKLVLADFVPQGLSYKLICGVLKIGNPCLCILLAKVIGITR